MITKKHHIQIFFLGILFAISSLVHANKLNDISYASLPGDLLQIRLSMSDKPEMPVVFTIDNPARIAMDLANTEIALKEKTANIGINNARSITAVKAGNRTRVVLNLATMVNYSTVVEGNDIVLTLNTTGTSQTAAPASDAPQQSQPMGENIQNIDFRRGEKGEGRIMISLADPNTAIDIKKRGKDVIITVKDSKLPESLERRLDVIDFATLVKTIDSFNHGNDVRLIISTTKDFDHIAYQTNDTFTVDVKPIVKVKKASSAKREYKGERLSLNFQSIDVRAVLQLIADFTGLNLITSDSVKGNLTLRLKNVPWDQALDIVLKSKGLGMEKQGNVISVAPISEIAARNKAESAIEQNAPLFSESIQVNYAKAATLAGLIKSKDTSLLSQRGRVSVDARTNRILIKDTSKNIEDAVALIRELDIPIRQVLIESRIVLATDTFSESLGVRFSTQRNYTSSDGRNYDGGLNVNLPVAGSTLGLAVSRLPVGTLVDLELSAAQSEGDSETVSSPRVITSDRNEASILTGTEIPYESTDADGNTTTTFKEANLELTVTPQITPDDRVIMDLQVTKDEPDYGNTTEAGPPINTNRVETQVLVDNGETVVLGGIYDQTKGTTVNRVPFLGEIPLLGLLFRNKIEIDNKAELLIFVTPKILKDKASL